MKKKYYIVINPLCSVPVMELSEHKGRKILLGGDSATLFKTSREANRAVQDTHAYAKGDEYISKSKKTFRLWTTHMVYSCVVEE